MSRLFDGAQQNQYLLGTTLSVSTAYANAGGQGDRTASISASSSIAPSGGSTGNLVNGSKADGAGNSVWWNTTFNLNITFDFGTPKVISEITMFTTPTTPIEGGSWIWQCSKDNVTFFNVCSTFTWNTATSYVVACNVLNISGYRYYRLHCSAEHTASPWIEEFEFKIGTPATFQLFPDYPITMAAWTYPTAFSDPTHTNSVMSLQDSDGVLDALQIRYNDDGTLTAVETKGGTDVAVNTSVAASLNTWNHVCGVFSSTTLRSIYLNGANKVDSTATSSAVLGIDRMIIAARRHPALFERFFSGKIADAVLWNVALTDTEIASLAKGVSPLLIRPTNIVCYWPLLGKYSPEIDIKGAYNLTVFNSIQADSHAPVMMPTRGKLKPWIIGVDPNQGFNPSNKDSGITLTHYNHIAIMGATKGLGGITKYSSGKHYFEMIPFYDGTDFIEIGLMLNSYNGDPLISSEATGWILNTFGNAGHNGFSDNYPAHAAAAGEAIGVALDAATGKIWFRDSAGYVTGDPAAGMSPAFTGTGGATYCPVASLLHVGGTGTGKIIFSGNQWSFNYPIPTGFSPWEV